MRDAANKRYDPLIQALIKHSNIAGCGMSDNISLSEGVVLPAQEWVVVELVIEHQEEYKSMVDLSRLIGLPPSTFFRIISHLQKAGLVDKFRISGNRKNIVLRPTALALKIYSEQAEKLRDQIWGGFYKDLERFSDEDIRTFTEAISRLNERMPSQRYIHEFELIKVE